MKRHMRLPFALLTAMLMIAVGGTTASAREDIQFTETKNFEVGEKPDIELETVSGDISYTVVSGTKATVEIIIDVRADDEAEAQEIRDEIDIIVEGHDGMLEARVKRPRDFSKWLRREFGRDRQISVSFRIEGPAGATGFVSSVSGAVTVDGIDGPVDISTVSGDLTARRIKDRLSANAVSGRVEAIECGNRVRVSTVSGDLFVENCGDDLDAESVSGEVTVRSVNGRAEVSAVSGDVSLEEIEGAVAVNTTSGRIDVAHRSGDTYLETVSGDITARSESSRGELVVESMSGSVDIYVLTENIGRVAVATFSGDIRLDDAYGDAGRSEYGRRGRGKLKLTLGHGELDLRVNTHSGDIRLREL